MKFKDVVISEASTEAKVAALALLLDKELIKLADTVLNVKKLEGPKGEQGIQGPKGEQGDRGFDGTNGKDGVDGKDGKDGEDGKQGVGVADAKIDFDGSLVITLTDGTEINAGDVVPLDTAEKIRVIGNGGGTSQSVLDAIDAINAIIATYGTMATQNADAVVITGGSINGTTIGGTTPAAATFTTLTATGQTSLGGAAGSEAFRAVTTASAVNRVEVTGGITGGTNFPRVLSEGSDSSTWLNLSSKGSAGLRLWTNASTASSGNEQMRISHTASAVNYVQVTGAATTKATIVSSQGSDSNISSVFQSKGTGAIDLAAGSSGVNISNGGTVTAITRTANGTNYTSVPSVAITAPTTAGGVTATATVRVLLNSATVASGGTGYTVGDVLNISGATGPNPNARLNVTAVSGGVITAVSVNATAIMDTVPSNPASFTGGTGTGATFNCLYVIENSFNITNAGSGYVEQPTVTFSGGGGSGAAAYASVGSGTVVRSLGTSVGIYTPSGESFRVTDAASTSAIPLVAKAGPTTSAFYPASGNTELALSSSGTAAVRILTNTIGQQQFQVSHTASAVNYVQVTGAATGGSPTISAQGSNADIDFTITPKGTNGRVRFGTYTALMGLITTGYIEIKDSGGTVRRLAVV